MMYLNVKHEAVNTFNECIEINVATSHPLFQDVQYGDIDIMERELDFTYASDRFAGLPEYVKELKAKGIKFMTILVSGVVAWNQFARKSASLQVYPFHIFQDPCISIREAPGSYRPFDLGEEMDVWVKRADGTNAVGKVWPEDPVYFPDYSNPKTRYINLYVIHQQGLNNES
jgi:alpha-glucosidase (family GH31 glycosyl hydrolase)